MTDPSKLCMWVSCDHDAMPGGYLCEEHLVSVLKGHPTTSDMVAKIITGLGIGVASSALYEAIRTAFDGVAFSVTRVDFDRPDLFEIAEELKINGNPSVAAIAVSGHAMTDEFVSRRLASILCGHGENPLDGGPDEHQRGVFRRAR